MKRHECLYLISVLCVATVISVRSFDRASESLSVRASGYSNVAGAAGKARDVDMQTLSELIQQDALSDHEAEFYTPLQSGTPTERSLKE